MYFYSKHRGGKIVHTSNCFHIADTDIDNIGAFESLEEVGEAGFRLCRHCSRLAKKYRSEKRSLVKICRGSTASLTLCDFYLGVDTHSGAWRIVPTDFGDFLLYHRNTYVSIHDRKSTVPGYHRQRYTVFSFSDCLKYVIAHDKFRSENPLERKESAKATVKGASANAKKSKKQLKKEARTEKRRAIGRVLSLIERIDDYCARDRRSGCSARK